MVDRVNDIVNGNDARVQLPTLFPERRGLPVRVLVNVFRTGRQILINRMRREVVRPIRRLFTEIRLCALWSFCKRLHIISVAAWPYNRLVISSLFLFHTIVIPVRSCAASFTFLPSPCPGAFFVS